MAIQTKMVFRFSGTKVDAIGAMFRVTETVPGDVAMGSEGPIDQHTGTGVRYVLEGVTLRIRPGGPGFDPNAHKKSGQEFDVDYDVGDPLLGGTTYTLQGCLCRGHSVVVNNENGDIHIEIPQIVATRRVPE